MELARIVVFLFGAALAIRTIYSAIQTFVLPRAANDAISGLVFRGLRSAFNLPLRKAHTYQQRDRLMALYAPIGLLLLPPVFLILLFISFALMYWAVGQVGSWTQAFKVSGSSLLTLGYQAPADLIDGLLMFTEAALGLILVAVLIAYLPTIYGAFQRREQAVTMLEVRAGSPPSAIEMILRYHRIHGLDRLTDLWTEWERWFADIEESHTSLAALVFFRSPQSDHSWVTAAGAVLDTAALIRSTVAVPHAAQADLCLRAGYLALRRIADFFKISYNPQPQPTDPISIGRAEFEAACDELLRNGVPLKPDRDQAWRDFAGWRVNYDTVLLALAAITMAPYAPWSSDRSILPARRTKNQRASSQSQMK
ncbi:hypothetical protein TFLX_05735 [Thermoflexales bacterium]|nr:hypothetical protein TFLX_05735 [Thermoflexales bacterium]